MAWETPKTDWAANPKSPVGEDFNRIEGNIAFLKDDIATRFSNVQTEIETKKGLIVNAMNEVGLEAKLTDTHTQLATKILTLNDPKLYERGVEVVDWVEGYSFQGTGIREKRSDHLYIYLDHDGGGLIEISYTTDTTIDLSNYSYIAVLWSGICSSSVVPRMMLKYGTRKDNQGSYATLIDKDIPFGGYSTQLDIADIKNTSGSYYIHTALQISGSIPSQYGSMRVYRVFLL